MAKYNEPVRTRRHFWLNFHTGSLARLFLKKRKKEKKRKREKMRSAKRKQ